MKKSIIIALLFILFGNLNAKVSIIPKPEKTEEKEGSFLFNKHTKVYFETKEQKEASEQLFSLLKRQANIEPEQVTRLYKKNIVHFKTNTSLPTEGYKIDVLPERIVIEAASSAGFFYASQSLLQLFPARIFGDRTDSKVNPEIPAITIEDAPKYPYRGFMLDVARYFAPKEEILKLLDYMAMHKINKFHWHLVDDNGWRLEIKKYPLLGTIGGFRVNREGYFPNRRNPEAGEPTPVGGFYTQEDVREIVRYAQKRQIEVIPEIEMPAHTNSSLAAYPNLTCPVVDHFLGTLPGIGGKNASAIYCAGNDQVFTFLQDVIDEVVELFPSEYIHIGGDEAWKDNWKKCPLCQKRMKEENIPNEEELQSYFIRRMNTYLKSKGKKLMGWDELTDSEIPEGSTIFGWRGYGQSAVKAAEQGYNVILTPAKAFYLIRYQGPQWFEPYTYFGNNTLKDVYDYEVSMSGFTPELESRIQGIQASMWTEFIYSPENLQYMLFPRLAALAEQAWSKQGKDWPDFISRMDHMCEIYEERGITYSEAMFNLFHEIKANGTQIIAELKCIRPDVTIRYTLDGTAPDSKSPVYVSAVEIPDNAFLLAQAFLNDQPKGQMLKLNPVRTLATGAGITGNVPNLGCLVNGIHGSERYTDGEYVDAYDQDINFTLDLGENKSISQIVLGTLLNSGMGVNYPESILIEHSADGNKYENLICRQYSTESRFPNSFTKTQIVFNDFAQTSARYIRFTLKKPGICPEGTPREHQPARMAFDEILIY